MGAPNRQDAASLAALILFGLVALGSLETDKDTAKVQSQAAVYTLSADQLYSEYDSNSIAADAKYKGRVAVVYGTVQNIGRDIGGSPYIVIGGKGFLDGVQCTFTSGEEASVARLSKGQRVTVKGEVSGKMGNVLVDKARLQ